MKTNRTLRRRYPTERQQEITVQFNIADNLERYGPALIASFLLRETQPVTPDMIDAASGQVWFIIERVTRQADAIRRNASKRERKK